MCPPNDNPPNALGDRCAICLQTSPLITKALTSTGGFIVGDTLAQVASNGAENYDW